VSRTLNIDTALDIALVSLAENGQTMAEAQSISAKDHASWLHPAIDEMIKKTGKSFADIKAVAVNAGPGSYTGLRVGMAAAKGVCYALNVPLITVSSLKLLASAVQHDAEYIICPLIDARRMEVYTAAFDKNLNEVIPAHALVVGPNSFDPLLQQGNVLFCGNAVDKTGGVISNSNAVFSQTKPTAQHLANLSFEQFTKKDFADLAYAEPFYVKEFYSPKTMK